MRGALAPRNRSTNQNAQIATNEKTNIPPHARKVDAELVVMTSSNGCSFCLSALPRQQRAGGDGSSLSMVCHSPPALSHGTFDEVQLAAVAL